MHLFWRRKVAFLTGAGFFTFVLFMLPDGALAFAGVESTANGWLFLGSLLLLLFPALRLFIHMKRRTDYMQAHVRGRSGGEEEMQHQRMMTTVALGMEYHNDGGSMM